MTQSPFWALVDESLAQGGGSKSQYALFTSARTALSYEEIANFQEKFWYFSRLANDVAITGRGGLTEVYEEVGSDDSWTDWLG